jgi:hypothetical protein
VCIFLKEFLVESFLLLVHSLVIGGKLLLGGFSAGVEGIAGGGVPGDFLGLLEGGHFLMRVVVGGSAFMRVGSFGEGVVIVFAEVGAELVFGEISKVLVSPFEVLLRLLQVELFAHSNVIIWLFNSISTITILSQYTIMK